MCPEPCCSPLLAPRFDSVLAEDRHDLKDDSQQNPHQPDHDQFFSVFGLDPVDEDLGHAKDQHGPGEDRDLTSPEISNRWQKHQSPQDSVDGFDPDDHEPYQQGTE